MRFGSRYLLFGGMVCSPLLTFLALPGRFSLWPLLFVSLVPLFLWISDASSMKQAAARGMLGAIVMYTLQLYWIISVLMKFGGLPWFVAVPALLLLTIYMGIYLAIFSGCFFLFLNRHVFTLFLVSIPAVWVGLDWLRSWLFGGFPWLDIGYGFWSVPMVLQVADIFGHYGYTFLVILVNLVLFTLIDKRFSRLQQLTGSAVIVVLICVGAVYSYCRWDAVLENIAVADHAVVGMVQGNVEQGRKWSASERARTVREYVNLSERLTNEQDVPLIIWPETAMPFYARDNMLFNPVRAFVKENQLYVLTGAPWYKILDWDKKLINYYNSAVLVGPNGNFEGMYHKSHLVPYGEYVPFKKYMPFLSPLVQSVGNFTPGKVEVPLVVDKVRLGVLICYESIFGTISRDWVNAGANLLVNLTNDAWYGKSSAPHQSWAMTVYRSVETRRSLVRSANTGISGVIDPLGRIGVQSELFVAWSHAARVSLMTGKTFFVRGGWLFGPLCMLAGVLAIAFVFRLRKQEK